MKVDWDHLRFFLVLARAKTLTNAARLIGVEHSTVARRIQALEQNLGTQLFKREATGYELTAEGAALVPRVEQMEQSFLQIDKPHNPLQGRIRIGAPEGFGTAFLARLLAEFSQHYPLLTIDLIPVPRMIKLSHREADEDAVGPEIVGHSGQAAGHAGFAAVIGKFQAAPPCLDGARPVGT